MMSDRKLEAALSAWGQADPLQGAGDEAALLRILQHADALSLSGPAQSDPALSGSAMAALSRHRPRRWLGGLAALAASLVMLALAGPSIQQAMAPVFNDEAPMVLADADLDDGMVFALLYTPTNDEEYQL